MVMAPGAAALCGILAACLLEGALALHSAYRLRTEQAEQLLVVADGIIAESHATLAAINASQFPICSEAELNYFRKLMFQANYLGDAGRMVDGRVNCSAALGRENLPQTRFTPSVSLPDATLFYQNLNSYQVHGELVIALQRDSAYVVLSPRSLARLDRITPDRAGSWFDTVTHREIHPFRQLPIEAGVVIDRDWQGRVGDVLLVTRCSVSAMTCVTTHARMSAVLKNREGQFVVFGLLGAVIGGLSGLAFWLLYKRNRSGTQQLRRAVRKGRIGVVYQPIVNLHTGRIVGAEALSRWKDDEGLDVGPDVFITMAERRGFIGDITRLVARRIVRDFAATLSTRDDFRLCMNISATDLRDQSFLPMLEGLFKGAGVDPAKLVLEITESSTAQHELAIVMIAQLRKRGFGVHIDDFGTGYSSLSYLHALSIDAIKIDRSFTQSIGTEAVTVSILPQILAMAKKLNLQIVVEGIETELQARYFCMLGPQILAQGWLFGRPMTAEAFQALLTEEDKKPGGIGFDDSVCSEEIQSVCPRSEECPHVDADVEQGSASRRPV